MMGEMLCEILPFGIDTSLAEARTQNLCTRYVVDSGELATINDNLYTCLAELLARARDFFVFWTCGIRPPARQ